MSLAPFHFSDTVADLLERLGDVAPDRVRLQPAPGTAAEADVLAAERESNRLFELVEGVLVEKTMGFRESIVALALAALLREHVLPRNLGIVSGPDGMLRLGPGLVRIPNVAFISWARLPGGRIPTEPIAPIIPELVIEIISRSNTRAELLRKRTEYFACGVELIWEIDIDARQATIFTSADHAVVTAAEGALDGDTILPGFSLELSRLFRELDRQAGD